MSFIVQFVQYKYVLLPEINWMKTYRIETYKNESKNRNQISSSSTEHFKKSSTKDVHDWGEFFLSLNRNGFYVERPSNFIKFNSNSPVPDFSFSSFMDVALF